MARKPREKSNIGIYFIFMEAAAGLKLFKDEKDFYEFFSAVKNSSKKHGCTVFAYSVQNSGIYFLLKENQEKNSKNSSVSSFMQGVLSAYAVKYNNRYLRCGAITNGRYKSHAVENFNEVVELSVFINKDEKNSSRNAYINFENDDICDVSYIKNGLKENGEYDAKKTYEILLEKKASPQKIFKQRKKLGAEQINALIEKIIGTSAKNVKNMSKQNRKEALKIICEKSELTVAEISRATEISRGIISRASKMPETKEKTYFDYKKKNDIIESKIKTEKKEDIWLL